jgi:hypothetical protein
VAAAAMKTAAATAEERTTAMAATALVMIALVTLAIVHFITCHVFANAIACVVTIAIAFVSMQQKGQWRQWQE